MNSIYEYKILLCLGFSSDDKWGCLKGSKFKDESAFMCAKREFLKRAQLWLILHYLKTILSR